jgi:hypothetical protein
MMEALTGVPSHNQQYLYKGKESTQTSMTTIKNVGLVNKAKVIMLSITGQRLSSLRKMENEQREREKMMQYHASKGMIKVHLTFLSLTPLGMT